MKLELYKKAAPHTSQEKSFSPLCIQMYVFTVEYFENVDP